MKISSPALVKQSMMFDKSYKDTECLRSLSYLYEYLPEQPSWMARRDCSRDHMEVQVSATPGYKQNSRWHSKENGHHLTALNGRHWFDSRHFYQLMPKWHLYFVSLLVHSQVFSSHLEIYWAWQYSSSPTTKSPSWKFSSQKVHANMASLILNCLKPNLDHACAASRGCSRADERLPVRLTYGVCRTSGCMDWWVSCLLIDHRYQRGSG